MTVLDLVKAVAAEPDPEHDWVPTWRNVERRALRCPVLQAALTIVHDGAATREEAMTVAALALSTTLEHVVAEYLVLKQRLRACS